MTWQDMITLSPLLVLGAAIVLVMLVSAFSRDSRTGLLLTLAGLLLSLAAIYLSAGASSRQITALLSLEGYALFYIGLTLATTLVVAILCYRYFGGHESRHETVYILLLLAALGACILVASSHFASFLLGLELLSVSLFALVAYPQFTERPLEAGIKYLILAGLSSGFLLFGMALIYAQLGTMQFAQIGATLAAREESPELYGLAGLALILAGVGFKLALVPFHMWTPDVYEGAPAPVTAFIATVSKGAVLALLLRYLITSEAQQWQTATQVLALIAIATILVGNLLALLQDNIKRILAYSSIAQLGYLLVGVLAFDSLGVEAVSYYITAYFVTMLGAFGVVTVLSKGMPASDSDTLADYEGLLWRRPGLAAVFIVMLLSLAGIPLTMGFIGKFYVVAAGVQASLWLPVIALVIGSTIGLFYYLRIIAVMCASSVKAPEGREGSVASPSLAESVTLAVLTLLLVWLGVDPAQLIGILEASVVQLT